MKNVCVITGGGSGMGLATAKMLGHENRVIIVGRSLKKLEDALEELRDDGIEAESFVCNISNRTSVDKLAIYARSIGRIASVIHAAGMSPNMGDAKTIMEANALGTININEAFFEVMEKGSCLIDVSSMSGHIVPGFIMPKMRYKYSRIDKVKFMKMMMRHLYIMKEFARLNL